MEDPANEVEGVIRNLVDHPTLERQAETLKKYFTEDVEFNHFYINVSLGLRGLIATYQWAQLMYNYSGADFHNIVYDEGRNLLAVRMTLKIRPWAVFCRLVPLQLFALLELRDVVVDGKTVKKVKVQRDYFLKAPVVQVIPIIGDIYASETLRTFLGNAQALLVESLMGLVDRLLHPKSDPPSLHVASLINYALSAYSRLSHHILVSDSVDKKVA